MRCEHGLSKHRGLADGSESRSKLRLELLDLVLARELAAQLAQVIELLASESPFSSLDIHLGERQPVRTIPRLQIHRPTLRLYGLAQVFALRKDHGQCVH